MLGNDLVVYDTVVYVPLNDMEETVRTSYQWGHCFSYLTSRESAKKFVEDLIGVTGTLIIGAISSKALVNQYQRLENATIGDYVFLGTAGGLYELSVLCITTWGVLRIINTCRIGINRGHYNDDVVAYLTEA